jgi:hypothetical protein
MGVFNLLSIKLLIDEPFTDSYGLPFQVVHLGGNGVDANPGSGLTY